MSSKLVKYIVFLAIACALLLLVVFFISKYFPRKAIEAGNEDNIRPISETIVNTQKLWQVASACEHYKNAIGVYPVSTKPLLKQKLLKADDLIDTFGNEIAIKEVSKSGFKVVSFGKDRKEGTEDDITVICSVKGGKLGIRTEQPSKGNTDAGKLLAPVKDEK